MQMADEEGLAANAMKKSSLKSSLKKSLKNSFKSSLHTISQLPRVPKRAPARKKAERPERPPAVINVGGLSFAVGGSRASSARTVQYESDTAGGCSYIPPRSTAVGSTTSSGGAPETYEVVITKEASKGMGAKINPTTGRVRACGLQ